MLAHVVIQLLSAGLGVSILNNRAVVSLISMSHSPKI